MPSNSSTKNNIEVILKQLLDTTQHQTINVQKAFNGILNNYQHIDFSISTDNPNLFFFVNHIIAALKGNELSPQAQHFTLKILCSHLHQLDPELVNYNALSDVIFNFVVYSEEEINKLIFSYLIT